MLQPSAKSEATWLKSVQKSVERFATKHGTALRRKDRELSAIFEIGCFHALLRFYDKQGYQITPENLQGNEYRYLTTPSGDPANFSYVSMIGEDGTFEIRQQVRIRSHVHCDIAFTPDLVVIVKGAKIDAEKFDDFAGGKRRFFSVDSSHVVAAHECKSMNPFPELLVSFVGMLATAHAWYPAKEKITFTSDEGHLAPTLFVGGVARGFHLRMVKAMEDQFKINLVTGLHQDIWGLQKAPNRLKWGNLPSASTSEFNDEF